MSLTRRRSRLLELLSKGHTHTICGLALSSDRVLLVSSSFDNTIKLWAFGSRQLLASFDVESWTFAIALSPDSRQLAYTNWNDCNIYICNISANILDSIGLAKEPQPSVCIHRIVPSFIR
jgi:WD40 repeat protein